MVIIYHFTYKGTLPIFTLENCDVQSTTQHTGPRTIRASSRSQWCSLFMHKTLVLLLLPLHKLGEMINSQLAPLNWMQNCCWLQCEGVSLENVLFSFCMSHISALSWLIIKIMHAFHARELELTWCKPQYLNDKIIEENIALESVLKPHSVFISLSYNFRFELHWCTTWFWQLLLKLMFPWNNYKL